jgi:hypothetical protein
LGSAHLEIADRVGANPPLEDELLELLLELELLAELELLEDELLDELELLLEDEELLAELELLDELLLGLLEDDELLLEVVGPAWLKNFTSALPVLTVTLTQTPLLAVLCDDPAEVPLGRGSATNPVTDVSSQMV